MNIVNFLKKLPIDLGQAERKDDSAGKRIAFSFIRVSEGLSALDIGCRDGNWSKRLEEKGYRVTAIDIAPEYAPALTIDVEGGLPFPDKSFDVVWCTEVIEHLNNPEFLFLEVDRILKRGGVAVLTTPNSHWWLYPIVRLWGWTPKKLQNPDHKQFFNIDEIRKIANGYDVFGYFPYAVAFYRIRFFVGFLSPTFIMVRRTIDG